MTLQCKRILIIKLGALGDFIQLTGFYAFIRKQYPQAHIVLLTTRPLIKLAQACPYFDEILIDKRNRNPLDWYHVTKRILADGQYDMILDFQTQTRTRTRYYYLSRFLTKGPFRWAQRRKGQLWVRSIPAKRRFSFGKVEESTLPLNPEPASLSFCKANPEVLK